MSGYSSWCCTLNGLYCWSDSSACDQLISGEVLGAMWGSICWILDDPLHLLSHSCPSVLTNCCMYWTGYSDVFEWTRCWELRVHLLVLPELMWPKLRSLFLGKSSCNLCHSADMKQDSITDSEWGWACDPCLQQKFMKRCVHWLHFTFTSCCELTNFLQNHKLWRLITHASTLWSNVQLKERCVFCNSCMIW